MSFGSSGPSALDQIGAERAKQVAAQDRVILERATEERDEATRRKDTNAIRFGGRASTAFASATGATSSLATAGKTYLGS